MNAMLFALAIALLVVAMAVSAAAAAPRRNKFVYPNGMTIDISDETLVVNRNTWESHQGGVYESDSIRYVYQRLADAARGRRRRARLVDIGAQSGLYALYARHFGSVEVDAYEPFAPSYRCLVQNIALNRVQDRVFPRAIAVSDKRSTTVMRCPRGHAGLNTLGGMPTRFDAWDEVQVNTDTLDHLYASRTIDVVKCDTEGWEYFVLKGGRRVLARDRPELLIEVNDDNMQQCGVTRAQLFDELADLGYRHVRTIDGENMAFSPS